ncbi:MAG: hypothetical protein KJO64_08830 [Bacteroidia bacterium]|nr:hypothetical protein [Bacteroidia bacterium]
MTTRGIKNRWYKLINIKQHESKMVGNLFLHHFFLGLGLALFFTVAGTFFLANFSVEFFPVVFMLSAIAMMIAGRIYSYFEHHAKIKELLSWVVLFLIA